MARPTILVARARQYTPTTITVPGGATLGIAVVGNNVAEIAPSPDPITWDGASLTSILDSPGLIAPGFRSIGVRSGYTLSPGSGGKVITGTGGNVLLPVGFALNGVDLVTPIDSSGAQGFDGSGATTLSATVACGSNQLIVGWYYMRGSTGGVTTASGNTTIEESYTEDGGRTIAFSSTGNINLGFPATFDFGYSYVIVNGIADAASTGTPSILTPFGPSLTILSLTGGSPCIVR